MNFLRTAPYILLLIVLLTPAFYAHAQHTVAARSFPASADKVERLENDVLKIINQYRIGLGLTVLQRDDNFSLEAEKHSDEMARKKAAFGHDGFEARIKRLMQKTGPLKRSAENVAFGQLTAAEVVNNWLKSPGHRKNIEGNYNITGIGIVEDKNGTLFFTQIFSAR